MLAFAMTRNHNPLSITGAISLFDIHERRGEIGYWVGVPFCNMGYPSKTATAIILFGFHTLALELISGRHIERNKASGRVMQKVGMQSVTAHDLVFAAKIEREPTCYYAIGPEMN